MKNKIHPESIDHSEHRSDSDINIYNIYIYIYIYIIWINYTDLTVLPNTGNHG